MRVLCTGAFNEWLDKVAPDVTLKFPYAPPGSPRETVGFKACQTRMIAMASALKSLKWSDVNIRSTDEPGVVITTAKSKAETRWGQVYENDYVLITRFRNGLVCEHIEYFDPAPVIAVFGDQDKNES